MKESEMKTVLSLLSNMVSKIIRRDTGNCVKRIPAVVISAENEIHYATVILPDYSSGDDQEMRLMNCCGKELKSGDNVMLEYTYGLSDAFIAIKNDGNPWGW